ncbi:hypothetical protein AAVH_19934 [Aphelenchoides avenae]|nr:hypothetical protein AAVH_19934 [Aphelenchus avenae]
MPLSVRMEFVSTPPGIPELANCIRPALRDVAINQKILRRYRCEEAMKFDVYHFQNYQTKDWLTVCLGKDREGAVGYVFMQKEKIMASVADIDKRLAAI